MQYLMTAKREGAKNFVVKSERTSCSQNKDPNILKRVLHVKYCLGNLDAISGRVKAVTRARRLRAEFSIQNNHSNRQTHFGKVRSLP